MTSRSFHHKLFNFVPKQLRSFTVTRLRQRHKGRR